MVDGTGAEPGSPPLTLAGMRAPTSEAADLPGLGAAVGRVARGSAADLIAVTGGPAERIKALGEVTLVPAQGRAVRGQPPASCRGPAPAPGFVYTQPAW